MTDHTTQSIAVRARPVEVMAVIADVERYPEWADAVKSVEILERSESGDVRQARFVLETDLFTDTYELSYDWGADRSSVRWTLLTSTIQSSQIGSYVLAAVGGGTEVTYELSVDLRIPMLGLFRRKAERAIIDTALKELKERVESLA